MAVRQSVNIARHSSSETVQCVTTAAQFHLAAISSRTIIKITQLSRTGPSIDRASLLCALNQE